MLPIIFEFFADSTKSVTSPGKKLKLPIMAMRCSLNNRISLSDFAKGQGGMSLPKEAMVPEHSLQSSTVFENPEMASTGILAKFLAFERIE